MNPGFEANDPPGTNAFATYPNEEVPGWDSTTGVIEIWDSGQSTVLSYAGNQHAEMNANSPGALYQNICFTNGETIRWTFAHRARAGGADPQVAVFEIASDAGVTIQELARQTTTVAAGWQVNSSPPAGVVYSGPTGVQRLQFYTTNPGSLGNFLDETQIFLVPYLEFSAPTASKVENAGPSSLNLNLIVDGTVPTGGLTVPVTVTGGTATLGTDFTTPSGTASFNVTIPAGTYAAANIPFTLGIVGDSVIEANETIILSVATSSNYSVANTATCGGVPTSSMTVTIADDDVNLVTRKTTTTPTVLPGQTASFNISITNQGLVAATNVSLAENLPAGLTLVQANTSSGAFVSPNWTLPSIGPGSTESLSIVFTVPPGTVAGTTYTNMVTAPTSDQSDTTNAADDLIETISVGAVPIDAVNDTPSPVIGFVGGSTPGVLLNDTLGGAPVSPAAVTLTPGPAPTPAAGTITMNPDGTVTIAAGTTAGTYSYGYQICQVLNPANCDTATATIVVTAPVTDAVNDAPAAVSGLSGGTTPSVLANDTLDGTPLSPATVTLTPGPAPAPATGAITMNPDGTVTIAAGTTAGTYSYNYQICQRANPSSCTTATATIRVSLPADTALVDDVSAGNQPGSPVTVAVLPNDTDPHSLFDRSPLQILGTTAPGESLEVPGQGVWTIDQAAGTITFTPEDGFAGDPTPIYYQLRDSLGNLMAPASLTVSYMATPTFVCADVIGKVFEDRNHDGHQDPEEQGIAAARLATVDGRIITTDAHGRFSLPCAEVPAETGSTLLLKLDPRSLPTGYRVVTENPLTLRLTPGTLRKMNFGVSPSRVIHVDLTAEAFDPASGEPTAALAEGLQSVATAAGRAPSFIRLSYFAEGEAPEVIKARLKRVEAQLQELWRAQGKGRLWLEVTLVERN